MNVTINAEQRLFVIPSGGGYSCLGFDVCYREALQLYNRLQPHAPKDLMPTEDKIGTLDQYKQYQGLLNLGVRHEAMLGTWFSHGTPQEVQDIIEQYRKNGLRLRFWLGDIKTGRAWLEEYDVVGSISRSTGTMKVPLLIPNSKSIGGGAILTNCIVKIMGVESKRVLYQHRDFHLPKLELVTPSDHPDFAATVLAGGHLQARFKKVSSAERWIAFMKGERMSK